jgi:hypothetical protein
MGGKIEVKSQLFASLAALLLFGAVGCSLAAVEPTVTSIAALQPGETERKLSVEGLERSYPLHRLPTSGKARDHHAYCL